MDTLKQRGLFIVVEGIDGSGKTTQAKRLVDLLKRQDIPAIYTREPGGTPVAEGLRNALLDPTTKEDVSPITELLVMFASRQQHIQNVILPTLDQGTWVVCDRFVDSSYAYQVAGHRQSPELFDTLNHAVVKGLVPDLSLFLDVPEEVYQQRLAERVDEVNRLDQQEADFYYRAREAFRQRALQSHYRTVIADKDIDGVTHAILHSIKDYVNLSLED